MVGKWYYARFWPYITGFSVFSPNIYFVRSSSLASSCQGVAYYEIKQSQIMAPVIAICHNKAMMDPRMVNVMLALFESHMEGSRIWSAQVQAYIPRSIPSLRTLELETTNHQRHSQLYDHGHVDNCPDLVASPQTPSPQKLTVRTAGPIGLPKIGDPQVVSSKADRASNNQTGRASYNFRTKQNKDDA